jgi:hypothetical protein
LISPATSSAYPGAVVPIPTFPEVNSAEYVPFPNTCNFAPGAVVPMPTFPVPLGIIARFSFVPVVISVEAPENVKPVDPIVLLVNVAVESVVTTKPLPEGNVKPVPSVPDNVRVLSTLNVLLLANVNVPVVSVTVSPETFRAFIAYGVDVN